ncbi:B9 domain-containing protein 1-like isoform X2 [Trichogramma pretiosum]|uniref:B9 domain-containing protein 1-like isoform X2 n=1 Tax=Trichogramma pretiosum TaxID=7493 RepID=UPI0006C99829|nr:B9 domain-containing protein 1-like isoform X2 [Trichogramma pretiosum]
MSNNDVGEFYLSLSGSVESGNFYEIGNAYCKYAYQFGQDWSIVAGIEEGLTQMSKCSNDSRRLAIWNFPLDIAFKSTSPHGWPQLLLSIYGLDSFGHDVIQGYGCCRLPPLTGRHEKRIAVYVPESSSLVQQFAAWITGRRPELVDIGILATGEGRELTRMRVQGYIDVTFNVVLKDFFQLGYDNGQLVR